MVREYALPEQFVTQNFDLSWRDGSYSIQSNVDHMEAARHLDIAGVDIYHDTQDELDGVTIALAGDLARSMKQNNYLVIETQAQSILTSDKQKLHYPGQLRLQAYSHLASGANMVGYWHWHSIHNSYETYWKGVLSHDMQPNPTYHEVARISQELKRLNDDLIGLKKHNEVAIYFSNESLSALEAFPISSGLDYGDIVRQYYELLYKQNIPCDFIDHTVSESQLRKYKALIVPPLYSASDEELKRLNHFVAEGGHILYSFKSGFTDENVQVRRDLMPGVLREVVGANYQQFNSIEVMPLVVSGEILPGGSANHWMELLTPTNGEVLATYQHDYWGDYAAIVSNTYGKGEVTYLGTWPSGELLSSLLMRMMKRASVKSPDHAGAPVTVRAGTNRKGKNIVYLLNYSNEAVSFPCEDRLVRELISGNSYRKGELLEIAPWDLMILEQSN
ncbi:beta-galactosidase [Marinoscillum furvescens]|uniref:beta-galactosidase n=1 Tax=Marinoscillum furvescens DSM 4134 TaxID=1122208 RepID=A0A3D9L5Q2_MARFU|nr:beta-galactosidase trimerization domain-containing protein [Marinoscillum furvescens]REE01530.1 beta-galactosidase-like protein [Marinoscillum furvescens DSM 4134]